MPERCSGLLHSYHVVDLVDHAADGRRVLQHDGLVHALQAQAANGLAVLGLEAVRGPDQRDLDLLLLLLGKHSKFLVRTIHHNWNPEKVSLVTSCLIPPTM